MLLHPLPAIGWFAALAAHTRVLTSGAVRLHAAEMADILTQLREEVKNIDETNWLYEGGETHIVKLRL